MSPEPRVELVSRGVKGTSWITLLKHLRGEAGEKLPNGRDTYEQRFWRVHGSEEVKLVAQCLQLLQAKLD